MNTQKPSRYAVPPFSSTRYAENDARCREDEASCAICGKPVKGDPEGWRHVAVVVDGGAAWGDESSDDKDAGYMGYFPIGPDCHRKHKLPDSP